MKLPRRPLMPKWAADGLMLMVLLVAFCCLVIVLTLSVETIRDYFAKHH